MKLISFNIIKRFALLQCIALVLSEVSAESSLRYKGKHKRIDISFTENTPESTLINEQVVYSLDVSNNNVNSYKISKKLLNENNYIHNLTVTSEDGKILNYTLNKDNSTVFISFLPNNTNSNSNNSTNSTESKQILISYVYLADGILVTNNERHYLTNLENLISNNSTENNAANLTITLTNFPSPLNYTQHNLESFRVVSHPKQAKSRTMLKKVEENSDESEKNYKFEFNLLKHRKNQEFSVVKPNRAEKPKNGGGGLQSYTTKSANQDVKYTYVKKNSYNNKNSYSSRGKKDDTLEGIISVLYVICLIFLCYECCCKSNDQTGYNQNYNNHEGYYQNNNNNNGFVDRDGFNYYCDN